MTVDNEQRTATAEPTGADHEPGAVQAESVADEAADLVRCEVTGKMCRPEDVVEFQGHTVSAEGKNVLLRKLMAGDLDDILPRPSFIRRFLCSSLDSALVYGIMISLYFVFGLSLASLAGRAEPGDGLRILTAVQLCSGVVAYLYYAIMHAVYGKTLGKMAGGYRVVKLDGSGINGKIAFVRAFWLAGVNLVPILLLFVFGFSVATVSSVLGSLISVYGFANCIALVADRKLNRALHDRLAGTRVVMDRR